MSRVAYSGPRFPFADLARAMRLSPNRAAVGLGLSGAVQRDYRDRGIPLWRADEFAIRAGFHPWEVWGDAWLSATEPPAVCTGGSQSRGAERY